VREQVTAMVDDWGVEVTRAEILDVNLDEATRAAMLQQLNAERARRAQVMEAEGKKRRSNWPPTPIFTPPSRPPRPAALRRMPRPMPRA
jgi:regulator of protease activity HflC (stomatin/prohibitin superfamily)